jgi:hypothetical protein
MSIPAIALTREEIMSLANAALAQTDGDPRGMCVTWSGMVYDWLTDKTKRCHGEKSPLLLQELKTLSPSVHIAQCTSAALPTEQGPNWVPAEHTYLMVGDNILDPSIGMYFKNYAALSQRVLGRNEPIFFGTRDELRALVVAAGQSAELVHAYPDKCFMRCWGNTSLVQPAYGTQLTQEEARQRFGSETTLMTPALSRAFDAGVHISRTGR